MKVADGKSYEAKGIGQITVITKYGHLVLKNVLFIPEFTTNLVSLTQLMKQDISLVFKHKKAHLFQNGIKIACATIKQGVLKLNTKQKHSAVTNVANSGTSNETWHKKFNDLNYDYLRKLKLRLSDEKSFDFDINQLNKTCHPCIEGKMRNILRSDRGGEYINETLATFLQQKGKIHQILLLNKMARARFLIALSLIK